jgi:hypothetical protein
MAVDFRPGSDQFRTINWTGPVTGVSTLLQLSAQLRLSYPRGVDAIVIASTFGQQGFKVVNKGNGIIAILIGLLLPAVQAAAAPGSQDRMALKKNLSPSGGIGFLMGDGSVRLCDGSVSVASVAQTWFGLAAAVAKGA